MAVPFVNDPSITYATKVNIAFPGTQTQATAAETKAALVTSDRYGDGVAVTVGAGAIEVAT